MSYAAVANASGFDEVWTNNTVILGPPSIDAIANTTVVPDSASPTVPAPAFPTKGYLQLPDCDRTKISPSPTPDPHAAPIPKTAGNKLYIGDYTGFSIQCGKEQVNFGDWQQLGQDSRSELFSTVPSEDELSSLARVLLGLEHACTNC
jgi:hypothetical protein